MNAVTRLEPTRGRLLAPRVGLPVLVAFLLVGALSVPGRGAPQEIDDAGARDVGSDTSADLPIGAGDVLAVEVFGFDELDRKVRVQGDGTILMPLLGPVEIKGLDSRGAARRIAELLADRRLVNDPQVTVFVEEFVSRSVSVQGAVQDPGVYQLSSRNRLLDVIGMAGGLAEKAENRVVVLRQSGGQDSRTEVDLERLVEDGEMSLNLEVRPGDVVVVPRERKLRVYVTGAVVRPGAVEFSSGEGITLLQAVTAAGGPSERANLRKVTVSRKPAGGEQVRVRVNLRRIQRELDEDLPLEPNDTVLVGEWLF